MKGSMELSWLKNETSKLSSDTADINGRALCIQSYLFIYTGSMLSSVPRIEETNIQISQQGSTHRGCKYTDIPIVFHSQRIQIYRYPSSVPLIEDTNIQISQYCSTHSVYKYTDLHIVRNEICLLGEEVFFKMDKMENRCFILNDYY